MANWAFRFHPNECPTSGKVKTVLAVYIRFAGPCRRAPLRLSAPPRKAHVLSRSFVLLVRRAGRPDADGGHGVSYKG